MKKLISLLLVLAMAMTLVACGGSRPRGHGSFRRDHCCRR